MLVSVFTPTNDSSFLPEVYKSLLAQTDSSWEWVILYNGEVEQLTFEDPRIKCYVDEENLGWIGSLKAEACSKATGSILLELDHDDLLVPTAIEEVKKAFNMGPEIGFVYSNTVYCNEKFEPTQRFSNEFGWEYREFEYEGKKLDECISFEPTPESISKIWYAPNHLRAFRKEYYEAVGGYDKTMRVLDDQDLICRLYKVCRFYHIDKPLYLYRVHGENSWLKYNEEIQNNVFRIYDKYILNLSSRFADLNNLRKIELGGRFNAEEGFETVDLKDADILADLNQPWPFEDNSVGIIRAIDVLEHLVDPIHTMKEIQRILVPGGWAFIQVPSTDGRGAFQDPTHKSFWNENSFYYYTKKEFAKWIDTPVKFQAARLYTTEKDQHQVCWTIAHLVNCKEGYRPAGLLEI